jgi:serine/threonine protein kinase
MAGDYPRKLGKYVLLKPMARGGMGEIYLAARGTPGFQKFCVIKRVIAEKSDRAKANRFLDEAKVVLRLSHANLVPTFDAGEIDGEFFIAMELVEGKDLREIWNRCVRTRTRIPLDVALHIGREIARALAYVHSYGDLHLVHRDVAPPNILLSYFGEVKLTDFGLARSVLKQEHTAPGVVFGRASYLAPEQARGEVADSRTDIYSLGIVLWELLTGNQFHQLANLDPATAMSLVRHPRVEKPSSKAPWITKELDTLLMRALATERDKRYQSAEEMRQALSDVITKMAPRADVERAAAFVRGLYENAMKEEREERDRLLAAAQALAESTATPPPVRVEPARVKTDPGAGPATDRQVTLEVLEREKIPLEPAKPAIAFPSEEEPSGSDFTGRTVDHRYRIVRKIGEGGMGTVYVGEHVDIGKHVAIKILHPAYSTEKELVERFRREARAASRIGHPNIIDVTDFGTTEDGCAYFVMEYLDGIDLADILTHERRLEPTRACQIAIQVCRALAAAHSAGVVHRDLKPENVFLVSRDGKADFVKVLDFGIARSAGRSRQLTNPGVAMGTPEYMAPEQAMGGVVDRRSDIYSVGALLYEMVTGSAPQIRNKEIVPPRVLRNELRDEIERTILHALEADPEKRYQTMAQLEYDIIKALWGRARAVNELLGLRVMRRRAETVPRKETPISEAMLDAMDSRVRVPGMTPGSGLQVLDRAAGRIPGSTSPFPPLPMPTEPLVPDDVEPPGMTAGRRFLGTFAALAIVAAIAAVVYKRLPWTAGARAVASPPAIAAAAPPPPPVAPAPPTEAELKAARVRDVTAQVETLLSGEVGFAELAGVAERLTRLRAEGAEAAAETLAARAAAKVGEAIETARAAEKPDEAVRWARAKVELTGGDAGAHVLLADVLYDAHQDEEAASEYKKALEGLPDDKQATRGLARVEKRLASDRRREARHAARAAARVRTASASEETSASPGEDSGEAQKSAASEPTPEQQ